jgi:hypothetical protein
MQPLAEVQQRPERREVAAQRPAPHGPAQHHVLLLAAGVAGPVAPFELVLAGDAGGLRMQRRKVHR